MVCREIGQGAVLSEKVIKLDDPTFSSSSSLGLFSTIVCNLSWNTLSQCTISVVFLLILEGIMLRQLITPLSKHDIVPILSFITFLVTNLFCLIGLPFARFDLPHFLRFTIFYSFESESTPLSPTNMMKPHNMICLTSKPVEQTKQGCQSPPPPPHGLTSSFTLSKNSKKLLTLKSKSGLALEDFENGEYVRVSTLLLDKILVI
ncbi:hypothetical protein M9H77_36394 [Catharanthus roseus]|uniref:Uncharacterized protein n=1 Tax=Catharanthus roseus TaxID=4058 RepID=A0ACB9ZRP6_CATRO|nr:hypothetical protein M9H77_36394 [Catharanthus roseus]